VALYVLTGASRMQSRPQLNGPTIPSRSCGITIWIPADRAKEESSLKTEKWHFNHLLRILCGTTRVQT